MDTAKIFTEGDRGVVTARNPSGERFGTAYQYCKRTVGRRWITVAASLVAGRRIYAALILTAYHCSCIQSGNASRK